MPACWALGPSGSSRCAGQGVPCACGCPEECRGGRNRCQGVWCLQCLSAGVVVDGCAWAPSPPVRRCRSLSTPSLPWKVCRQTWKLPDANVPHSCAPSESPTTSCISLNPPPPHPTQWVDNPPPIHTWRTPFSEGEQVRTPDSTNRPTHSALMAPNPQVHRFLKCFGGWLGSPR